jgi:hypothetical protein
MGQDIAVEALLNSVCSLEQSLQLTLRNLPAMLSPQLSTSSNFLARLPFGEWAFPVSVHLKIRLTLFVGFSPDGFGLGKPLYPEVTLLKRL